MLVDNLHNMARLNHRLGGVRAVLGPLARLIRLTRPRLPIQALDLGAGAADIPRAGYVVTDSRRSRLGCAAQWAVTRLMTSNPLTRAEAPAAVLHGFTPRELRALAEGAGLRNFRVRRMPWFHLALYGVK